jgi:hypothetical protein
MGWWQWFGRTQPRPGRQWHLRAELMRNLLGGCSWAVQGSQFRDRRVVRILNIDAREVV